MLYVKIIVLLAIPALIWLQADFDLMERRREIEEQLRTIVPLAA